MNEECTRNLYVVNNGKFNVDFNWEVVPSQNVHNDVKLMGPDVLEEAQKATTYFRIEPAVGYVKVLVSCSFYLNEFS